MAEIKSQKIPPPIAAAGLLGPELVLTVASTNEPEITRGHGGSDFIRRLPTSLHIP